MSVKKSSQPFFHLASTPSELRSGLKEIQNFYPHRFSDNRSSLRISFQKKSFPAERGYHFEKKEKEFVVSYVRPIDAFRALGILFSGRFDSQATATFQETPRMKTLGVMLDVSRNGVLRVDVVKELLRKLSLMGINAVILYTEDTYEVPGEPFFGYLRGGYSQKELKELDRYASRFGIEMFPCIQTLGHMEQMFQWLEYKDLMDVDGVLLAEDEKTYKFIEKLITTASSAFRSKRIHIGMDEAHGVGTGRYLKQKGYKRPFDVLNAHLKKVREICLQRGLKPMIWSDMYFRLGSKYNHYYDEKTVIPQDVIAGIPKDIQLVYWDYYHTDQKFYEDWIHRHHQLGSNPVMAGGVWTWSHFWAALPFSFTTTNACMSACKKKKVDEAFVTMWGDDGMECDIFSALPGIQYFADHGHADQVEMKEVAQNFLGSCNATFDSWVKASDLDLVPGIAETSKSNNNSSKWQLWDDPLLGVVQPHRPKVSLQRHYQSLALFLQKASKNNREDHRLIFPAQIARVLALKCDLVKDLRSAYQKKNRPALKKIQKKVIPALQVEVRALWKIHHKLWLSLYRPFGLEVLEQRYGGLLARLESLSERLQDYLEKKEPSIPEFETTLHKFYVWDTPDKDLPRMTYGRASTSTKLR
ncbi:MAG: beta-N-acetylhexosaminidase [Verrucomicrobiota bacterium]